MRWHATFTTWMLKLGTNSITAADGGDSNFTGSKSKALAGGCRSRELTTPLIARRGTTAVQPRQPFGTRIFGKDSIIRSIGVTALASGVSTILTDELGSRSERGEEDKADPAKWHCSWGQ